MCRISTSTAPISMSQVIKPMRNSINITAISSIISRMTYLFSVCNTVGPAVWVCDMWADSTACGAGVLYDVLCVTDVTRKTPL